MKKSRRVQMALAAILAVTAGTAVAAEAQAEDVTAQTCAKDAVKDNTVDLAAAQQNADAAKNSLIYLSSSCYAPTSDGVLTITGATVSKPVLIDGALSATTLRWTGNTSFDFNGDTALTPVRMGEGSPIRKIEVSGQINVDTHGKNLRGLFSYDKLSTEQHQLLLQDNAQINLNLGKTGDIVGTVFGGSNDSNLQVAATGGKISVQAKELKSPIIGGFTGGAATVSVSGLQLDVQLAEDNIAPLVGVAAKADATELNAKISAVNTNVSLRAQNNYAPAIGTTSGVSGTVTTSYPSGTISIDVAAKNHAVAVGVGITEKKLVANTIIGEPNPPGPDITVTGSSFAPLVGVGAKSSKTLSGEQEGTTTINSGTFYQEYNVAGRIPLYGLARADAGKFTVKYLGGTHTMNINDFSQVSQDSYSYTQPATGGGSTNSFQANKSPLFFQLPATANTGDTGKITITGGGNGVSYDYILGKKAQINEEFGYQIWLPQCTENTTVTATLTSGQVQEERTYTCLQSRYVPNKLLDGTTVDPADWKFADITASFADFTAGKVTELAEQQFAGKPVVFLYSSKNADGKYYYIDATTTKPTKPGIYLLTKRLEGSADYADLHAWLYLTTPNEVVSPAAGALLPNLTAGGQLELADLKFTASELSFLSYVSPPGEQTAYSQNENGIADTSQLQPGKYDLVIRPRGGLADGVYYTSGKELRLPFTVVAPTGTEIWLTKPSINTQFVSGSPSGFQAGRLANAADQAEIFFTTAAKPTEKLTKEPTLAGDYLLHYQVKGKTAAETIKFKILPKPVDWTQLVDNPAWKEGNNAPQLWSADSVAPVSYLYAASGAGDFELGLPTAPGTYLVKAQVTAAEKDGVSYAASTSPTVGVTIVGKDQQVENSFTAAQATGWTSGSKPQHNVAATYGTVEFEYAKVIPGGGELIFGSDLPYLEGTYAVRAKVPGTTAYQEISQYLGTVRVVPATNAWVAAPTIASWTQGEQPAQPQGATRCSTAPTFTYQAAKDGQISTTPPATPGRYKLLANEDGCVDDTAKVVYGAVAEEVADFNVYTPNKVTLQIADVTLPATIAPVTTATFGQPEVSYRKVGTETWTTTKPTAAGTYEAKAAVAAATGTISEQPYAAAESPIVAFKINPVPKPANHWSKEPDIKNTTLGQAPTVTGEYICGGKAAELNVTYAKTAAAATWVELDQVDTVGSWYAKITPNCAEDEQDQSKVLRVVFGKPAVQPVKTQSLQFDTAQLAALTAGTKPQLTVASACTDGTQVELKYRKGDTDPWVEEPVLTTGTWQVQASTPACEGAAGQYAAGQVQTIFRIVGQNKWEVAPQANIPAVQIADNQVALPRPEAKAAFGEVKYSYSSSPTGPFEEVPAQVSAGTWYVQIQVTENSGSDAAWTGLTEVREFQIVDPEAANTPAEVPAPAELAAGSAIGSLWWLWLLLAVLGLTAGAVVATTPGLLPPPR